MPREMNDRAIVAGLGFATSIGNSGERVAACLRDLKPGFERVDYLGSEKHGVHVVGTVKGFSVDSPHWQKWRAPEGSLPPKRLLMGLPPHGVYAYHAVLAALEDAGLTAEDLANERTGLYCASAGSAFLTWYNLNRMHESEGARGAPFGVLSSIAGTLNFNLGAFFGIKGCNLGFASACASSAHALGYAWEEIISGRQDRMVVIGAEDINAESVLPFAAMRTLSASKDPECPCRPFDANRDGFVSSGGAAVVILESPAANKERNGPRACEMLGWGQSSDGYSPAIPDPEGGGIERAMRLALERSGQSAGAIDYVNAHATGTGAGDLAEGRALLRLFEKEVPPISSTKGLTGHPLSMAGAMEAAFCALALREGFVPGSAGFEASEDELAALPVLRQTEMRAPHQILSNSCGFGGSNVSLVLVRPVE